MAGREAAIARNVGHRVAMGWLRMSRFVDVVTLAIATLALGEDASAFHYLGWAQRATGQPRQALASYEQALRLYREAGNRGNEAASLNNIGEVYDGLGDRRRALVFYGEALPIRREVGDRAGEAVTRYNIAMVHRAEGDLDKAIDELEIVVELDRQVEHPDLASDTAMLEQVRQERAAAHE
ncbi:tetratricopeptide repeat protein [Solwaraspora sp. WMMD937]|uniref:tetratricopeptide repeat protein n=1 Tax=Solwaraspora sp. WMMD937 TaxID=3016090 RepID=UPI00249B9D46|nr:tetratricopeptide repeat protein [Solwaraspora sp. WMMD937]WFE22127.1 tetratricopeptide repeat protein [Solwaraspora sp. WMMD937]